MESRESEISNQGSTSVVVCPFCKSTNTEMISLFGMQLMTTQHYCNNCHSAFEAVKWQEPDSHPESSSDTIHNSAIGKPSK